MTRTDNELLTRVGRGTPMGALLREYWIPFLQSVDLPEPDGSPRRVRLLGEDLVAFRDTEGRVGLLEQACPHRCASLFFGRNEENGLRCLYHGWKFDIHGRCMEIPNEPTGSLLKDRVAAVAYPCVERNGLVWAYLGPHAANPPPLPELGWAMVGPERRCALRYQRACNWLQAMEGDFDSSHLSFLHLAFDPSLQGTATDRTAGIEYYRNITRMDRQPLLEVRDTEAGVMYGARREADEGGHYWRVTQFLMPFYTSVPAHGGKNRAKIWVPLDDEHTLVWEPFWSSVRELSDAERKGWEGRVGPSGFLPDTAEALGFARFAANAGNDYLLNREWQRRVNFSGMENVTPIQDAAMQESMGAICDRSKEHLGASDAAIVALRRRLLRAARALRRTGEAPPGLADGSLYHLHGEQMLLEPGVDWAGAYQTRMSAAYAAATAPTDPAA